MNETPPTEALMLCTDHKDQSPRRRIWVRHVSKRAQTKSVLSKRSREPGGRGLSESGHNSHGAAALGRCRDESWDFCKYILPEDPSSYSDGIA